jgi:hypothetical protein
MLSSASRAAQPPRHYLDTGEAIISQARRHRELTMSTTNLSHFLPGAHGRALLGKMD